MSQLIPREFPPNVFARLAPDVFLDRHLEQGARPTGRRFDEFRPLDVQKGEKSELIKNSLGSAAVRSGDATVICGIIGGLTNFEGEGGVYANVEVYRGGRNGPPTLEEMALSQAVHQMVKAAHIDATSFHIKVDNEIMPTHRELVLQASIRVLSRTGPSMSIIWAALVAALEDTLIPKFVLDEKTQEAVPDFSDVRRLELPDTLATKCSSFGLINGQILADIDGYVEELCVTDIANVFENADGKLSGFSLRAAKGHITGDTIEQVLAMTRK